MCAPAMKAFKMSSQDLLQMEAGKTEQGALVQRIFQLTARAITCSIGASHCILQLEALKNSFAEITILAHPQLPWIRLPNGWQPSAWMVGTNRFGHLHNGCASAAMYPNAPIHPPATLVCTEYTQYVLPIALRIHSFDCNTCY